MKKCKLITPLLTIIFSAVACQLNPVQEQTVSVLEVTELELEVREEHPLFLSPNGEHIAWLGLSELCIYKVDQKTTNCTSVKSISDERSLRWSPDSNFIAFTESFISSGHDADIWVFDLQNSSTLNLTDDNFDANTFDQAAMADVIPHWFANSQDLAFVRYHTGDNPSVLEISTTNKNGGQTNHIIELDSGLFLPVQSIDTSGENIIAFTRLCDYFNCDTSQQGIWVVETGNPDSMRRVLWLPPREASSAWQVQFSASGDYLSACTIFADIEGCKQIIVPVRGEDNDYLELPDGTEAIFWSPTTDAFLAIINNTEDPGLYFFPEPGEEGTLIHPGQYLYPTKVPINGLTWASNNTVLLLEREAENLRYLLLTLESE